MKLDEKWEKSNTDGFLILSSSLQCYKMRWEIDRLEKEMHEIKTTCRLKDKNRSGTGTVEQDQDKNQAREISHLRTIGLPSFSLFGNEHRLILWSLLSLLPQRNTVAEE